VFARCALPSIPEPRNNSMPRSQWLWMQASLAVMAAAVAAIRRDVHGALAVHAPAPVAQDRDE
jgi:hypothetical protein